MNGAHDMGGMHGMGPIVHEKDEPVFHVEWERRAAAITLAAGFLGRWNLDETRYARELMPPAEYLASSYYAHWLHGLERQLVDTRLLTREEIARRLSGDTTPPVPASETDRARMLRAADAPKVLLKSKGARVAMDVPPRFRVGEQVLTRKINPAGHTRLPRYARGRRGVIHLDHGVFIFPDTHAMSREPKPQHVYSVRFSARELWGPEASARHFVHVDCWDDYLERA
jgi:nitrile hydratase subunit beta